jgi:hypothetical protein
MLFSAGGLRVAGRSSRCGRTAWPNVLLIGGGVGVFVVSFLLILSLIRTYLDQPRIPAARPMLATADPTPVALTGLAESNRSVLDMARTSALENLAAVMARGESPLPATAAVAEAPAPAHSAIPLPPRRPRDMLIRASSDVPIPRPRPAE